MARGGERKSKEGEGGIKRKERKPDRDRPLAILDELPRHIIDGSDVVCIHRMTQAEGIG